VLNNQPLSSSRAGKPVRGRLHFVGRRQRKKWAGAAIGQRRMFCFGCGSAGLCARGLCRACYNGYYRSQLYFSGFREEVLARDGWRCRVCSLPTNVVHHRRPGKNHPRYLISLCPAHHAVVTRLLLLDHTLPPLLFLLWREQHPVAPEQLLLPWPEKRINVEGASLPRGRRGPRARASGPRPTEARTIAHYE
jgi:hypothetical protein